MDNLIFVCGNQRSGTTWLANILDSSPETLLLIEPFAPQYNLFKQFPHEFIYVKPPSPFLSELLRKNVPRLINYKSVLFRRSDIGRLAFHFESYVMGFLVMANRVLRSSRLDFASNYQLLSLNRVPKRDLYFPKHAAPKAWVIKELRLSGKINLIASTFPSAKFILIVRHPVAVVNSVLTWFERGHLGELKQNMDTYLEHLESQCAFQSYAEKIEYCKGKSIEYRLALYWLINNEIILKQFAGIENTEVVLYENLAQNPGEEIKKLFEFAGLTFDAQVADYIRKSSSRSVKRVGVVNTNRISSEYYRQWQSQVSESLRQAVLDITDESELLSKIERCYKASHSA